MLRMGTLGRRVAPLILVVRNPFATCALAETGSSQSVDPLEAILRRAKSKLERTSSIGPVRAAAEPDWRKHRDSWNIEKLTWRELVAYVADRALHGQKIFFVHPSEKHSLCFRVLKLWNLHAEEIVTQGTPEELGFYLNLLHCASTGAPLPVSCEQWRAMEERLLATDLSPQNVLQLLAGVFFTCRRLLGLANVDVFNLALLDKQLLCHLYASFCPIKLPPSMAVHAFWTVTYWSALRVAAEQGAQLRAPEHAYIYGDTLLDLARVPCHLGWAPRLDVFLRDTLPTLAKRVTSARTAAAFIFGINMIEFKLEFHLQHIEPALPFLSELVEKLLSPHGGGLHGVDPTVVNIVVMRASSWGLDSEAFWQTVEELLLNDATQTVVENSFMLTQALRRSRQVEKRQLSERALQALIDRTRHSDELVTNIEKMCSTGSTTAREASRATTSAILDDWMKVVFTGDKPAVDICRSLFSLQWSGAAIPPAFFRRLFGSAGSSGQSPPLSLDWSECSGDDLRKLVRVFAQERVAPPPDWWREFAPQLEHSPPPEQFVYDLAMDVFVLNNLQHMSRGGAPGWGDAPAYLLPTNLYERLIAGACSRERVASTLHLLAGQRIKVERSTVRRLWANCLPLDEDVEYLWSVVYNSLKAGHCPPPQFLGRLDAMLDALDTEGLPDALAGLNLLLGVFKVPVAPELWAKLLNRLNDELEWLNPRTTLALCKTRVLLGGGDLEPRQLEERLRDQQAAYKRFDDKICITPQQAAEMEAFPTVASVTASAHIPDLLFSTNARVDMMKGRCLLLRSLLPSMHYYDLNKQKRLGLTAQSRLWQELCAKLGFELQFYSRDYFYSDVEQFLS